MNQDQELQMLRALKQAQISGDQTSVDRIKTMYWELKNSDTYAPPPTGEGGQYNPELGPVEGFVVDMGRGFTDIGQGVKSLGLDVGAKLGVVPQEEADQYRADNAFENAEYSGNRGAINPGRLTGQIAATLPIPGGIAGGLGKRMLTAGAAGAAIGAGYPVEGESPWTERAINTGIGVVGGAGSTAALAGLGRGFNAITGKINPVAKEMDDLGRALDIPVTYGDVKGQGFVHRMETWLENLPGWLGMGPRRAAQNKSQYKGVYGFIDGMTSQVDDVGEGIRAGAKGRLLYGKQVAKEAFDGLADEADGLGRIPFDDVSGVVKKRMQFLEKAIADTPEMEPVLRGEIKSLIPYENMNVNYSQSRLLRDQLNDQLNRLAGATQSVADKKAPLYAQIAKAWDDDLDKFFGNAPTALGDKYNLSKSWYKEMVVPFKTKSKGGLGLNAVAESTEPDKLMKQWVVGDRKDRAIHLWNNLNDEGREAVKYGILDDAWNVATHKAGSDMEVVFSPAMFASTLERYSKAIPTFFSKEDQLAIEGLKKLMRHTARGGQFAENVATGNRVLQAAIGGGLLGGAFYDPEAVATLGVTGATLALIFGTNTGRRILVRAAGEAISPSEMGKLSQELMRMLPKAGAATSVSTRNAFE